jgi:hypothetical protein
LDKLLNVLGSFRNALLAEAQAITEYERATKRGGLKKERHKAAQKSTS